MKFPQIAIVLTCQRRYAIQGGASDKTSDYHSPTCSQFHWFCTLSTFCSMYLPFVVSSLCSLLKIILRTFGAVTGHPNWGCLFGYRLLWSDRLRWSSADVLFVCTKFWLSCSGNCSLGSSQACRLPSVCLNHQTCAFYLFFFVRLLRSRRFLFYFWLGLTFKVWLLWP